jgi:hypothetical protein
VYRETLGRDVAAMEEVTPEASQKA